MARADATAAAAAPGARGRRPAPRRAEVHAAASAVPLALADAHRPRVPGARVRFRLAVDGLGATRAHGSGARSAGPYLDDLFAGAGFAIESVRTAGPAVDVAARRARTLADTVGPGMRLLVCGLNPSEYAADVGVGFARPGNRFWPAARAAGLVTRDRDPRHALVAHGLGMTDLVKRPTRRAAELDAGEYRAGAARVERLVRWLAPDAVCFVGLAGYRAACDRRAAAGWQVSPFGDAPTYVMPSTSGLNTHETLRTLTDHLARAAAGPGAR